MLNATRLFLDRHRLDLTLTHWFNTVDRLDIQNHGKVKRKFLPPVHSKLKSVGIRLTRFVRMSSTGSDECTKCGSIPSQPYKHHLPPLEPALEDLSSFTTYSCAQKEKFASTAANIRMERSKMDDVINNTQAYLKHLLSEREKLSNALDKQQSLLAPIRDLPDEILSEVFLCLKSLWGCDFTTGKPPLLLMYVCKRWRVLATSMQALWSHICLDDCPPPMWLLEEFLTRSGEYPLTIDMHCGGPYRSIQTALHPSLTTIIKYVSRWQSIKLVLTSELLKKIAALAISVGAFSMLRSVNLTATDDRSGSLWKIFEHAPSLRDASVRCIAVHGTGEAVYFALPLSQLQSYVLQRTSVRHCLRSLEDCPNLIHFTAECIRTSEEPPLTRTHQIMGQLKSLAITASKQSYFSPIFDFISAPALKDLGLFAGTIDTDAALMENAQISAIPFLVGSSCDLEKLTLSGLTLEGKELIDILRHLPCLTQLVVAENRRLRLSEATADSLFTEEVFRRLTMTTSADDETQCHPILVPRLRSLWFTGHMDVSDEVIFKMIQSRIELEANRAVDHPIARIESVFLDIWRSTDNPRLGYDLVATVALWQGYGLEVEIDVGKQPDR